MKKALNKGVNSLVAASSVLALSAAVMNATTATAQEIGTVVDGPELTLWAGGSFGKQIRSPGIAWDTSFSWTADFDRGASFMARFSPLAFESPLWGQWRPVIEWGHSNVSGSFQSPDVDVPTSSKQQQTYVWIGAENQWNLDIIPWDNIYAWAVGGLKRIDGEHSFDLPAGSAIPDFTVEGSSNDLFGKAYVWYSAPITSNVSLGVETYVETLWNNTLAIGDIVIEQQRDINTWIMGVLKFRLD